MTVAATDDDYLGRPFQHLSLIFSNRNCTFSQGVPRVQGSDGLGVDFDIWVLWEVSTLVKWLYT